VAKKKTQLIAFYPSTGMDKQGFSIGLPLGFLHTLSLLSEKENNLIIIDGRIEKNWKQKIKRLITKNTLVLISAMTGYQIKEALDCSKYVKSISKEIKTIWGGMHPTLFPDQTLKNKFVDFVVVGDGEETILEFLKYHQNKNYLSKICGLGYKLNNQIIINKNRKDFDFRKQYNIPYHLIDVKNYYENFFQTKNSLTILGGRGCPYKCTFCYENSQPKKKFQKVPVSKLIRNMKKILEFKPGGINIVDDIFFYNSKQAENITNRIIEEKIKTKFMVNVRMDFIYNCDISVLKRLKQTGFHEMFIGIESGSQTILNKIKKGLILKQIIEGNKKINAAGIKPIYSFMAGFPDETFKDVKKTIDLMLRIKKDNPKAALTSLKIFTPFPKTPLFKECEKKGFRTPKNLKEWQNFDFNTAHNTWLSKRNRKRLEKLSYITYFLDEQTIENYFSNKIMKQVIRLYCKIIIFRCKNHIYFCMPEITLFKLFKKLFF